MKITIILLLIILATSACASPQPIVQPLPTPGATATPVPASPVATQLPTVVPVVPPLPGPTSGSSTPQAVPNGGVTMADNGNTFSLHPGESFLLDLGTDTFSWNVSIDNPDVLAMKPGVLVIRGAQGIYQAIHPGQAVLTAIGKAVCQPNSMCMALAVLFKITVIVQ